VNIIDFNIKIGVAGVIWQENETFQATLALN
jgi:hypothetical protein